MRKYIPLIGVSMLVSLFIYLFYRTDKTVINQLVLMLVSEHSYHYWKELVSESIPLKPIVVYSLPEGLWVFCITLTSRFFRLEILWFRLNIAVVPLILAILMEMFQLLHLSKGTFDPADLLFASVFWWAAYIHTDPGQELRNLRLKADFNSLSCMFSYSIVYLAHVIK